MSYGAVHHLGASSQASHTYSEIDHHDQRFTSMGPGPTLGLGHGHGHGQGQQGVPPVHHDGGSNWRSYGARGGGAHAYAPPPRIPASGAQHRNPQQQQHQQLRQTEGSAVSRTRSSGQLSNTVCFGMGAVVACMAVMYFRLQEESADQNLQTIQSLNSFIARKDSEIEMLREQVGQLQDQVHLLQNGSAFIEAHLDEGAQVVRQSGTDRCARDSDSDEEEEEEQSSVVMNLTSLDGC